MNHALTNLLLSEIGHFLMSRKTFNGLSFHRSKVPCKVAYCKSRYVYTGKICRCIVQFNSKLFEIYKTLYLTSLCCANKDARKNED